jgi:hypothetical protein
MLDRPTSPAHGRWGITEQHPDALIFSGNIRGSLTDSLVYKDSDFEANLAMIRSAREALYGYYLQSLLPTLKGDAEDYLAKLRAT